jgi:short subunit fatty acids transporter
VVLPNVSEDLEKSNNLTVSVSLSGMTWKYFYKINGFFVNTIPKSLSGIFFFNEINFYSNELSYASSLASAE